MLELGKEKPLVSLEYAAAHEGIMSERPRTIWIGSDTSFVLEAFTNESTGTKILDITDGTLKLYNGKTDALFSTITLIEIPSIPADYEGIVPDDQSGLSEGAGVRMQFDISGGAGLTLRIDARAIARVKKDDGL